MREPTHAFRNRLFVNQRGLSTHFAQLRQVSYRSPDRPRYGSQATTPPPGQGGFDTPAAHDRLALVPLGMLWRSWG